MKVLPIVAGGSTLTVAGVLSARPSAAIVASLLQLGGLMTYGLIQRSLQRQSQRSSLELMERAKDCQVSVVVHETGRIEITPASASTSTTQAPTSPAPNTQWIRCIHWVRRHLPP